MNVYRGPSTKDFWDESHEFVAQITATELEDGIRRNSRIRFNITKEGVLREAVCTAVFEEADIVPMANGLLARLAVQQENLGSIKEIIRDEAMDDAAKIVAIREIFFPKS